MFKKEVEHMVSLGVLEKTNDSEWWDPPFFKPKLETNCVIFISKFNFFKQADKSYALPDA